MPADLRRGLVKAVAAVRGLADLGSERAAAMLENTLAMAVRRRRDRWLEDAPAVARTPGRLLAAEPDPPGGCRCRFTEGELQVRYLAPDFVRVSWGPDDPPVPWATGGPSLDPDRHLSTGPLEAGWSVDVAGDAVTGCFLRPAGLPHGPQGPVEQLGVVVEIAPDGTIVYRNAGGAVLRRELPPIRRGVSRVARFELRPGERVCGLGEQASPVDLGGTAHRLWHHDPGGSWGPGVDPLYCAVPVLIGLHAAGDVLAFYENPYDATVRVDRPGLGGHGRVELAFAGGMLRHYVAAGAGRLPQLIERYTALTGRPPLPPRWALGYHQSRWGYRSRADVQAVADRFAADRLPLSAIHLDIDHLDGYRVFTVDQDRYPDLAELAAGLGKAGTRLVAIVDPGVKADRGFDVYQEGRTGGHFVTLGTHGRGGGAPFHGVVWPGRAAFPDFTDPATRRWWSGLYRRLADDGIAGAWHDMNEPTSLSLFGDRTLPRAARHAVEGRGGDHRECHNVYGLLMNRAGWEGLTAACPDRRPFLLSRAGWAGGQRWAWHWTGDSDSTWEGLAQQVPTVVGMGLSGLPFAGPDIGGFSGAPGPELYLRWLELSVLLPFCRTHSVLSAPAREPWCFPEPFRTAIGRLIRFRYRLLPYLYTLAHEASTLGTPLVRPLCWPGRGPWADDAFLLGNALLVAPALRPGSIERRVALPPGDWFRWRPVPPMAPAERPDTTGPPEALPGGRTVTLDTPLGQPVVLVRAGTVLPLDDGWAGWADEDPEGGGSRAPAIDPGHCPRLLAFHCYPDSDRTAAGHCYDDAGDGDGPWRVDRLRLAAGSLGWGREGAYPPPDRVRVAVTGGTALESGPFDRLEIR